MAQREDSSGYTWWQLRDGPGFARMCAEDRDCLSLPETDAEAPDVS
jgi:hypothetical protein